MVALPLSGQLTLERLSPSHEPRSDLLALTFFVYSASVTVNASDVIAFPGSFTRAVTLSVGVVAAEKSSALWPLMSTLLRTTVAVVFLAGLATGGAAMAPAALPAMSAPAVAAAMRNFTPIRFVVMRHKVLRARKECIVAHYTERVNSRDNARIGLRPLQP